MRLLKPKLEAGPTKDPVLTRVGITGRRRRIFLIVGPLLVVALLAVGGYAIYHTYIYKNPNAKAPKVENVATIQQHINHTSAAIDKTLKEGDLQSYQVGKLETANDYISLNNFASASAALQDVKTNVPEKQLSVYYYQLKLQIDKHNNDNAAAAADQQKIDTINKAQSTGPPDNPASQQNTEEQ